MEELSIAVTGRSLKTILQSKFKNTRFSITTNKKDNTLTVQWENSPVKELVDYYINQIKNCDKTKPIYFEINGKVHKGKVPNTITVKQKISRANVEKAIDYFNQKAETQNNIQQMKTDEVLEIFNRYEQDKEHWTEEEKEEKENQKRELIEEYNKKRSYDKDKKQEMDWMENLIEYMDEEFPLDEKEDVYVKILQNKKDKELPWGKKDLKLSIMAAQETIKEIELKIFNSPVMQIEAPEIQYKVMQGARHNILEGTYRTGRGNYGILGEMLFYEKGNYIPENCEKELKKICGIDEEYNLPEKEERDNSIYGKGTEIIETPDPDRPVNPEKFKGYHSNILRLSEKDRNGFINAIAYMRAKETWPRELYKQIKDTKKYKKAYIRNVIKNAYENYHRPKR